MCRRHDQDIPDNLLPHFYRLIVTGLLSNDLKINYAIIMNLSKIFNLPLPGSFVIVPTLISTIEKLVYSLFLTNQFLPTSQSSDACHPEIVLQMAVTLLSSLICSFNKFDSANMKSDGHSTSDLIQKMKAVSNQALATSLNQGLNGSSPRSKRSEKMRFESELRSTSRTKLSELLQKSESPVTSRDSMNSSLLSVASSQFQLALSSRSETNLAELEKGSNIPKPSKAVAPVSGVNLNESGSASGSYKSVFQSSQNLNASKSEKEDNVSARNMPRFEYSEKQFKHTGSTSIVEEKIVLKNLLLSLFHEQIGKLHNNTRKETSFFDTAHQEETAGHLICAIALMAFDEIIVSAEYAEFFFTNERRPRKEIVEDCINCLLGQLTLTFVKPLNYITDALTMIAHNSKRIEYLEDQMIQGIIEKLVGALTDVTTTSTSLDSGTWRYCNMNQELKQ